MAEKYPLYAEVEQRLKAILSGETDWVARMSTVACELHHGIPWFNWTGFYRVTSPGVLSVGPYQGGHGCLRIPFSRGVCGRAAREGRTLIVPDVRVFPDHIACSVSTLSEIVVPVWAPDRRLLAVLDVDSDALEAFDGVDQECLERVCHLLVQEVDPIDWTRGCA